MLPRVVAGHTLPPATGADAEDVLRIALANDIAETGRPDYDLEDARAGGEARTPRVRRSG